ncbi:MAG: hypothetical protein IT307_12760 [Chloroflexi bacterium]|nr:hypothetical protein [Chloroflexota bacterium]
MAIGRRRIALTALAAALTLGSLPATPASAQVSCTFTLGFKALHDQMPDVVGDCLENERFNPRNGNAEQRTKGGLLVWRKADNWTAFTNGATTWINGPEGLVSRPNAGPLFPWETPAPSPPPAAQPGAEPPASSQQPAQPDVAKKVDPRDIALKPEDLPPGFKVVPDATKYQTLENGGGVMYLLTMGRDPSTPGYLTEPVAVAQVIMRIDNLLGTSAMVLTGMRDSLVKDQGMTVVQDAPNDATHMTLSKKESQTDSLTYGYAKGDFVIATIASGLPGTVTLPPLIKLSETSGERLDAATR